MPGANHEVADTRCVAINQEEGRNVRRTLLAVGLCMAVLGFASPARAALLTITDTAGGSNTVWTLDVAAGCITCAVTLKAEFQDPAGAANNNYTGTFIDSVQWSITGTDPVSLGTITGPLDATTTTWSGSVDAGVNANQCGTGANNALCAQSNDALGYGPIINGQTYTWTFSTTFASALPSDLSGVGGNIRAAFNNADGQNFNIFSPNGGTFGGTGGGTGAGGGTGQPLVPEPTSLLLFGTGLSMAAYRARRRKQNQKKD
jgi:PEP-CTERM motif